MARFLQELKFHLWIPNLSGNKGGIQAYSSFFVSALQKLYPQYHYRIFSKLDRRLPLITDLKSTKFYTSGDWPKALQTVHFAFILLAYGLRDRPNLIITTHANFAIAAFLLKRLTRTPYWIIAHGIEVWNIDRPNLKIALQNADRILAVSHYTRDRLLQEQNLNPAQIKVLPNTFDQNRFQIAPKPTYLLEQYHLSPEQPIILTVARLDLKEQYKGYDLLLQALPKLLPHFPTLHYLIVGKGEDTTRIQKMIQALNLTNHVTLTGFIPDIELCDHYNLCDVFAMPSKAEGFGIVYLEALACGKPTLGGNQDGARDALCHGELGALVDPDNLDEIAQTLIQILQKNYPNSLMYQPQALRQKVIEIYGFESFKQTLNQHLSEFWQEKHPTGVD